MPFPAKLRSFPVTAALVSLALLVPCIWQPHIQAGDLSSHLYNTWLTQLASAGQAPGITIVSLRTNVLFDLLLEGAWRLAGPRFAEVSVVGLTVLVFFWGAFALLRRVHRTLPWTWTPCLAMLAYGWVFRSGFFNFYLSLGLCFWAMAVAWNRKWKSLLLAAVILLLAYTAHALPIAWACGLLLYSWILRHLDPARRWILLVGALVSMAATGALLTASFPTRWGIQQVMSLTGSDQLFITGAKSLLLALGLAVLWLVILNRYWLSAKGTLVRSDIELHLFLLSAASTVLIPTGILLPGFAHGLLYISDRMSLCVAVCACLVLAKVALTRGEQATMAALTAVFFAFSYVDERAASGIENAMVSALQPLPPGQRVVSGVVGASSRVDLLGHAVDRACIGRCFSYGNYEPATRQFRIRVQPGSPVVVQSYADSYAIQTGSYTIKETDLPIYALCPRPGAPVSFELRGLQPSEKVPMVPVPYAPDVVH